MFLEEMIINGILCFRTSPDEEFRPYSLEDLTGKLERYKVKNETLQRALISVTARFQDLLETNY